MSTTAHVGTSQHVDSASAGREAAATALSRLGQVPVFAIAFASADHDHHALLKAIEQEIPGVPIVGCSGEGVIAGSESNETYAAAAVMLVSSDRIRFTPYLIEEYGDDPSGAGHRLAALVNDAGGDARCLCVMPDGIHGNCTQLLEAIHETLRVPIPVVGGAAADAMTFERTYQFAAGRVVSRGLAAFLISGAVDVEVAVSHGCSTIGGERSVTKSQAGWIHEIDGQPAWQLFKEYLGEETEDLNAEGIIHLCLAERLLHGGDYDPFVIRTPMQLDKSTGALFFPGGGLTEGEAVQLTRRDPDKIRASARECATKLRASHGRVPDLVLQFDCAGRGRILWGGSAAAEIVAPLRQVLGPAAPWIGFHTYGEIAPIAGRPYYHNYTVALAALYERPAA